MPSTPSVQAVTKFLLPAGVNFQQKLCLACSDDFPGWKRLPLRLRISLIFIMDSLMVTVRYAQHLLTAPDSFNSFKSMTVFQDRNEYFNAVSRLHREELPRSHQATVVTPPVIPSRQPVLAWEFATASLCLEYLSISFMIDAADFFDQYREKWLWCELRSLTLTSQLLTCNGDSFKISGLLQTAAQMATRMPKLERLTIWNGEVNEACAFTYRKHQHNASVTWQAKGGTQLHPAVHSAWGNVHSRCFLSFESKGTWPIIMSHAAAISCLELEHVVSDVSLRQMQLENSTPY
ncbi:hypothetical protein FOXYSP1_03793 [Fusarium oxysporum f. sp. phaseoli]